jgi:hypothetical protein
MISIAASVLAAVGICAFLIGKINALSKAFPGEPLTNPLIYNPPGVLLAFFIVGFISVLGIAGLGYGSDSIRKSRAQGVKPSILAVLGTILGLIDQIIIIFLMGFLAFLLIEFAK